MTRKCIPFDKYDAALSFYERLIGEGNRNPVLTMRKAWHPNRRPVKRQKDFLVVFDG